MWKEPLEALRTEFGVGPEVDDAEVLALLEKKAAACQLIARMGVGLNKSGKAHYVDLFDLAPAVSAEGMLAAFHNLPALPGNDGDGLAPLCCKHLHQDEMGQLQAKFEGQTRLISGATCMFRVRAEPEQFIVQDVDGLIAKINAECCVCNHTVTLQQAWGSPKCPKNESLSCRRAFCRQRHIAEQRKEPFEVMQLRPINEHGEMHEKLHKFQASEYQKFVTGAVEMDISTTPSKGVHDMLSTPRQAKRLKIEKTADAADIQ